MTHFSRLEEQIRAQNSKLVTWCRSADGRVSCRRSEAI